MSRSIAPAGAIAGERELDDLGEAGGIGLLLNVADRYDAASARTAFTTTQCSVFVGRCWMNYAAAIGRRVASGRNARDGAGDGTTGAGTGA